MTRGGRESEFAGENVCSVGKCGVVVSLCRKEE